MCMSNVLFESSWNIWELTSSSWENPLTNAILLKLTQFFKKCYHHECICDWGLPQRTYWRTWCCVPGICSVYVMRCVHSDCCLKNRPAAGIGLFHPHQDLLSNTTGCKAVNTILNICLFSLANRGECRWTTMAVVRSNVTHLCCCRHRLKLKYYWGTCLGLSCDYVIVVVPHAGSAE